jgi:tetratricopeptide (TPR) repeat protein
VFDPIADLLKVVLACPGRAPAPAMPRALDPLFRALAADPPSRPPGEIEDEIWALWTEHEDAALAERMERAIAAMARKSFREAELELDTLVDDVPDWAEAWNKRATLYYLMGRHDESLADIARTLALEPRHFGAICGFGQICLAQGRQVEALAAFETALGLHPHLDSVREAVKALGAPRSRRLN